MKPRNPRTSKRKHNTTRTCRGKVRFRDLDEANAAIRGFKNHSQRDTAPSRAYDCDLCNGVHITSKVDKTDPLFGYRGK